MSNLPDEMMAELRRICLAYPGSSQRDTWDHPNFRVRDKIFVIVGSHEGSPALSLKAAAGEQQSLLAEGDPFFLPPYVGSKGWIGVVLDGATDWSEIAELIDDSYRAVAPTRLVAELDEGRPGAD